MKENWSAEQSKLFLKIAKPGNLFLLLPDKKNGALSTLFKSCIPHLQPLVLNLGEFGTKKSPNVCAHNHIYAYQQEAGFVTLSELYV
jgi:hypothetical protein